MKIHDVVPTEKEFNRHLRILKKVYEDLEQQTVVIFDAQQCRFLPSEIRIMQAIWLKENLDLIKTKVLKTIYIIPNPVLEFLLESIFILQKYPIPFEIVHSMEAAIKKSHLIFSTQGK